MYAFHNRNTHFPFPLRRRYSWKSVNWVARIAGDVYGGACHRRLQRQDAQSVGLPLSPVRCRLTRANEPNAMTPELWERLSPLFMDVIDRPGAERRAAIGQVCAADPELERELLALVDAYERDETGSLNVSAEALRAIHHGSSGQLAAGYRLLDRFTIVRHLDSGGMGSVYEAFDSELSHSIALKVIRPDIAHNESALLRFKQEVHLAQRLSGPNICRIHELFIVGGSEESSRYAFLTMELLQGETLAELLRKGPVPKSAAEQIAFDLCAALSAIHHAGIIHRDLKTRNVMMADRAGRKTAVLMDFGLARELAHAGSVERADITLPGSILGTPDYMAPEQFEEGGDITPATDIYALGVVLYELATGRQPYASSNPLEAAIRRARKPEPVSSVSHAFPHRWDRAINKCLEYDPARRFSSAAEVARALQSPWFGITNLNNAPRHLFFWPAALILLGFVLAAFLWPALNEVLRGLFSPREKHIAVLPFDFSGSSQELGVVSDGLMEALTGKLANLDRNNHNLWVVPASEIRSRKIGDAQSAFREFGATMVVRGRLSRLNHDIRLTLELIDAGRMREIGFADIERADEDLAALQNEAVERLGRLMNIGVAASSRGDEAGASGSSYNDYVAALGYLERYDKPGNLALAIRTLTSATEISPRFAPALGALCRAYTLKFQIDSNPDSLKPARQNCQRAIALDDKLPGLHANLAELERIQGHYDVAAQEFQRVIDLDPGDVDALTGLASLKWRTGNLKEAERLYIQAAQVRKQDWKGYNLLANFYDRIGRHQEAFDNYKRALDLTPDNSAVLSNLGGAYLNSNDPALFGDAIKVLTRSNELSPSFQVYANLGIVYLLERRYRESAEMNEKATAMNADDYTVWCNLLDVYEWLGEGDKASMARQRIRFLTERAIGINEKNADAHSELASVLAKNHEREAALGHIRTALALEPTDQNVLAQVAEAYEVLGERLPAIRSLQEAIRNGFPKIQIGADASLAKVAADPRFQAR